jgi:hypothetical protein
MITAATFTKFSLLAPFVSNKAYGCNLRFYVSVSNTEAFLLAAKPSSSLLLLGFQVCNHPACSSPRFFCT